MLSSFDVVPPQDASHLSPKTAFGLFSRQKAEFVLVYYIYMREIHMVEL